METRRVRIELIDEMLGTNPNNKNIHEDFISSNSPNAETRKEELEHLPVEEMVNKEMTVFYRGTDGSPEIACYHMYGFFKSACGFLRNVSETKSKKLTAYKKKIDGLVRVYANAEDKRSRFIKLHLPEGGAIGNCQRPLRAQTMQGERVALANSETVPAGTWFECDIVALDPNMWGLIEEWLDYGVYNGLGQWRNSGKGAFIWQYVQEGE